MKNLTKQTGSAILTALFIMILVAIAATAMSLRLQIDINRTQLIDDVSKLREAVEEGRTLVLNQLLNTAIEHHKNQKEDKTALIDRVGQVISKTNDKQIRLTVKLVDLQSRFNLNNLKDKGQIKSFALLLKTLEPEIEEKNAYYYSLFIHEWINPKNNKQINITTETFYAKQKPPYSPSHRPFISISELRMVKGINADRFIKLLPFITALPETTQINLNTATKPILITLGAGLTDEQADELIKLRKEKPFTNISKVMNEPQIKKLNLSLKEVTLSSDYFLIVSQARQHDKQLILFTKVKRTIDNKGISIDLLQETINTL